MRARRILSCILLPAYLSSCVKTWEVQRASPEQVVEEQQPSTIRIGIADGSEVVLEEPRVSGDSVVGLAEREFSWKGSVYLPPDTSSSFGVPLADISQLAVKKTDVLRSIGIGVLAVVVLGTAIAVGMSTAYCSEPHEGLGAWC